MFLSRAKRPILGVDMTVTSVKLVELAQSGESYRVEAYAAEPIPADSLDTTAGLDVEAIGKTVRRAVKRLRYQEPGGGRGPRRRRRRYPHDPDSGPTE